MCCHCGSNKKKHADACFFFYDILLRRNEVAAQNDVCYRTFYHVPQADIIAHTMRTSFRRKADKRRY